MKIETKILATLLGLSLLVALAGGLSVDRPYAAAIAAAGSVTIATVIAFYLGRSTAEPTEPVAEVFNHVTHKRLLAEEEARRRDHELDVRVVERTAELAMANEALQRRKSELQVLFDLVPAMILFKDTENNILRVNKRVVEVSGKPAEEIEGKSTFEFLPLDAARVYADDLEVMRSGAPKLGIVDAVQSPDGRELWIQTDKVPYRDNDGKVIGIVVMAQDITERRRIEEELKEAKITALVRAGAQRYSFLADTVPLIIWTARPDGSVDYYNRVWFNYTGLTLEETEDWGWRAVVHPEDLEACVERWTHSFSTGENYEIEYRFKRGADGAYRWFLGRASARRNEEGEIVQWVGTCTDIEDQKRARSQLEEMVAGRTRELQQSNHALHTEVLNHRRSEEELRWKTAFLQAQVNCSIDGILVVDKQGMKILQNQRFVDLFKIPQVIAEDTDDAPQVRWVTDTVKNSEHFIKRVRHLYAHPDEISRDEIELNDGTILDRYSSPVVGKDRNYYGRIWTFRDITERKQFEARLFQSQKLETVGKLAGGIAHEFNSILTALIGQNDLLLAGLPGGSPLVKNATEIRKAADRAATLTRQLLAYGRKQHLQLETLDLNRVVSGMEDVLHHLMGGEVVAQIIPAAGLQAVKADAGQIEQVIINLAINASDAMPAGGKFTLQSANVSFDGEGLGRHPELKPGDYVKLAVTDTGTGMSAEVKARAFEPFFTTKEVGRGTGLGLSTCYGIIKQSGGHISVHSQPGQGTTFNIYLPRAEPELKPAAPRLDSPDLPRGTETILLVESDPALRDMAAAMLRRLGYTVLAAADEIEALSLKQQPDTGPIALLFSDVIMPYMNGTGLPDRMLTAYPHARILFSSASNENAAVPQGGPNERVAMLQKPFTPAALARRIREVLDQPDAPPQGAV